MIIGLGTIVRVIVKTSGSVLHLAMKLNGWPRTLYYLFAYHAPKI